MQCDFHGSRADKTELPGIATKTFREHSQMFLKYRFALFASIFTSVTAQAAVYTVGADGACTHTTIAAAAASAAAHPGPDEIHVAYNLSYTAQAISVSADEQLDVIGGFADCTQATSDGSRTTIDGAGGATEPVFRINVDTGGLVRLSYLTIQHGDEDGTGKGGGIYFKGNGILELNHVAVTNNIAGYGGGIYAEGTGDQTELVIGTDVAIVGNIARYDGGGIVNDGTEMTMIQPDSYMANNQAQGVLTQPLNQWVGGYGGGLLVRADSRDAYTYLGSAGLGNVGPVYLNQARYGGGIAVYAPNKYGELDLFTTDNARPMRIKDNTASVEGGGIYLGPSDGFPWLQAWDAWVQGNIAPHGAAIMDDDTGNTISFNEPAHRPLGSIDCPSGAPCGGIVGNSAIDTTSQPSGGIIETNSDGLLLNRISLDSNDGKYLIHADTSSLNLRAQNVAFTGNTVSDSLIVSEGSASSPRFENVTIGGNSIGGGAVLKLSNHGTGTLHRSIVWQPGKTTLQLSGGPLDLIDDMVSERGSVDGGNTPYVIQQDPRFVDPAHGDYSLRAGSPAIDSTTDVAGDSMDLNSNPRDVDLPIVDNFGGPRDLGAIERQTLQPLVLNSDFNEDLRLWNVAVATAGSTSWDVSNVSGTTGSGSAHVTAPSAVTGSQIGGIVQCIHLPGPGVYELNGFGHGTGGSFTVGDVAELYWEYRKSGGEGCTGGTPNAFDTKPLSSVNSWSRASDPAHIVVSAQDWTYTSSIAVTLVARENGVGGAPTNAWFDGITLSIKGEDTIFANSFE
jgi:hypothetical protein